VEALLAERSARRTAFEARPGTRLVVEAAEGQPLWPQGFDPLNVHRVDGGVLHTRFLRLGNEGGYVEMVVEPGAEVEALTEAAGPHPLFNGVSRLVIAGLTEPEVEEADGAVSLRARGVTLQLSGAAVEQSEGEVRIRLAPR
jgi:hypothetical protein